jgi:hypothetical protein
MKLPSVLFEARLPIITLLEHSPTSRPQRRR